MPAVQSSNLSYVDYNPWTGTLTIEFQGERVYEYYHVPASEYSGLMAADSHGRYFHAHIKDRYTYRRIQ